MNAQIHPALVRLKAIQEQRRRFEKWKAKFSQILSRHLNNLFIHMVCLKIKNYYIYFTLICYIWGNQVKKTSQLVNTFKRTLHPHVISVL